jgi:enoyl-CoA hydratase/carnithine racemase
MTLLDQKTAETAKTIDEPVLYEKRGGCAIVSLNRPRFGNAQNKHMLYALDGAFMRAVDDDEVGAIVLRGEGKHFSSGHDLGTPGGYDWVRDVDRKMPWYEAEGKPGAERGYAFEQEMYLGLCRRWRDIPKPTIAAVHGACIAGGLMLAWICDIIVASEDAYFTDPVVAMGVPGVEYFAHAFEMPARLAREFLMLGEKMTAQRAHEVGMVNRVVRGDRLLEEALSIGQRLAERPRFALALTKQAFNFVDDLQGKRTAMEGVFAMHHLAHSHNYAVHGMGVSMRSPKDIKKTTES